jgi:hypothetical protein
MDCLKDLGDTTLQEQDLTTNNDMNITISKQLMQVFVIQQEPEEQFNLQLVTKTAINSSKPNATEINTISPDKKDKPKHQVITTKAGQQGHSGKNINDDGFTLVQRTHKSHQPSSLDQLKKQLNISKHGLLTPMVSFCNSYIAYYNLRILLLETKDDASPWDEVLRAFKAMMTELWGADPTIKIFISNTKAQSNDTSFLDSPRSFKDLNQENFTEYFFNGYPLFEKRPNPNVPCKAL